jgi:uncharacterized repeat protein (TIGR01451 family)
MDAVLSALVASVPMVLGTASPALAAPATGGALSVAVQAAPTPPLLPKCSATVLPPCVFQGFEIDGDTAVHDTGNLDWQSPPTGLTHFDDPTNTPSTPDDIFSGGSKELDQSSWVCTSNSAPPKSDIYPGGDIAVRNVAVGTATHQVVDTDFLRVGTGGSAHIDYEFNKATAVLNTAGCPSSAGIPLRSVGDILLAFDSDNGGSKVTVSAYRWNGSTFKALDTGSQGTTFEGVENGITTNGVTSLSDPNTQAGQFGEAGLDLTATIGNITCGEFGRVYMKTRSASQITSEVKDRTRVLPFNIANCPKSSLVKSVHNDTSGAGYADSVAAAPGDQLTYRLVYTNSGTAAASQVTVSDPLPAHETLQSCTQPTGVATCSSSGGTISWGPIASVAPGTSLTFTFTVTLDRNFTAGAPTLIKNIATATTTEEGSTPSNEVTVSVTATPHLTIAKVADSASVSNGDPVGYTITVTSDGNVAATNVRLTDTLPNNSGLSWSVNPAVTGCSISTANPPILTCTRTSLARGSSLVVHITSGTTSATCGTLSNSATVTADGNISTSTPQPSTIVVNCATITLDKKADSATVAAGQQVGYTLTLKNTGTGIAKTVSLTDTLPNSPSGLSWSLDPANTPSQCGISTANPQVLSCTWATIAAGQTYTIHVVSATSATTCGTISNKASATSSNAGSPSTGFVTITVTCPHLAIVKTADNATVSAGDQVGYTITVNNTGNGAATNVQITDTLPNASGLSWSLSPAGTPSQCSISSANPQVLTCTFASMDPGTIVVHVVSPTTKASCSTLSNQATVTSPNNSPTSITSSVATTTVQCPSLHIAKSADQASVTMGTQIGYTITFSNTGTGTAHDVVLTDHLPSNSGLSWSMSPLVGGCSISGTPQVLTCSFPVFGPGSVSIHVISQTGSTCGTVTNGASVVASNADGDSVSGVTINVTCAVPQVTKTACPQASVVPGGFLTYTITYKNIGNGTATQATIVDTIPVGSSVADPGGGTISTDGRTVTWQVGPLAPGAGGTKTLVVLVTASSGATLTNSVTMSSPQAQTTSTDQVSTLVSNAGAVTHGSAYAVDVKVPLLGQEIGPINPASSTASAAVPGPTADDQQLGPVDVPPLVHADLVEDTSTSQVTSTSLSTATSETAFVSLLSGAIKADVAKGVSQSEAGPMAATYGSPGSYFTNLVINGSSVASVKPNTHVTVYLPGTKVKLADAVLLEESGHASLTNGLWSSDHQINVVHVTLVAPLGTFPSGTEIVVNHAQSDATYPTGLACGTTPSTVSGDAYSAYAKGVVDGFVEVTGQVGDAVLPPYGGADSDGAATVSIPSGVLAGAATNSTSGSLTRTANATSAATIAGVNLIGGVVTADLIDVTSSSSATGTSASTTFGSTCANSTCPTACVTTSPCFVNLAINGTTIVGADGGTVAPNTTYRILEPDGSILLIVLNEQKGGSDGAANTNGTINAIHIYALMGQAVNGEIIIAHAHSDAHQLS